MIKNYFKFIMNIILISFFILINLSNNAYAYLDPGTGSIILQALAGVVAAATSYFYYYGGKVKEFFKRFKKDKDKVKKKEDKVDNDFE
tara:strand:- start:2029 stop:2292 length:264 start_codon:yes stop_codon:yes gene_type:complete